MSHKRVREEEFEFCSIKCKLTNLAVSRSILKLIKQKVVIVPAGPLCLPIHYSVKLIVVSLLQSTKLTHYQELQAGRGTISTHKSCLYVVIIFKCTCGICRNLLE